MQTTSLKLDEALVSVVADPATLIVEALDVYYQVDACERCPLEKLKRLDAPRSSDFVVGTKFNLQLELRGSISGNQICYLSDVGLANHGHYKIHLDHAGLNKSAIGCWLETVDKGECALCPLALVLVAILLVTLGEIIYTRFRENSSRRRRLSKVPSETQSASDGQDEGSSETGTENNERQSEIRQVELAQSHRVDTLDAFRGLTIAGMIMVNYGGAGYSFLEHKPWNGLTLADLVFPFFIFSMGASIALSTRSMMKPGKSLQSMLLRILRRSLILMALGLCLNSKWLNGRGLADLRLTGVLQRFSISYLAVALIYGVEKTLERWIKAQGLYRVPFLSQLTGALLELIMAAKYLAIYIYVTFYLNYSDECPAGYTGPGGESDGGRYANCTGGAAAWLDHKVLGQRHLYLDHEVRQIFKSPVSHDPEGLLGYTTSILLTLIGLQCGKTLIQFKQHRARLIVLLQWFILLSLASISVIVVPINKRLWSITFVTITGAAALLCIILLYIAIDGYRCRRTFLLKLLLSAGKNSIFLYVGHSLLDNMLPWYFAVDETSHPQLLVRLVWSTLVWLLVAHYMALKGLFIRV